jgi:hypothetical protein
VGVSADVFYDLNYTWHALNSVEIGVKDMHIRGGIGLHKHLSGSKTLVKGTKVLSTNATRMTVIDKVIGKCPLCVPVKIQVDAPTSLDYELDVKGQGDFTAGATFDIDLGERSVKWDRFEGWTTAKSEGKDTVKPLLDVGSVQSEADLKLDLATSMEVHIDDMIWYRVNLKPSFPVKCTEKGSLWPIHKAQFCVDGDPALTVGHEADLHWSLLAFKEFHHWGPYQDYSWSKPGLINDCKDVGSNKTAGSLVV